MIYFLLLSTMQWILKTILFLFPLFFFFYITRKNLETFKSLILSLGVELQFFWYSATLHLILLIQINKKNTNKQNFWYHNYTKVLKAFLCLLCILQTLTNPVRYTSIQKLKYIIYRPKYSGTYDIILTIIIS